LAVCCLTFLLCSFSLWIFMQRQLFHVNLVLLIINFHIHGLFLVGGGIFLCTAALLDFSILGEFFGVQRI
jgi:hypothetical protein